MEVTLFDEGKSLRLQPWVPPNAVKLDRRHRFRTEIVMAAREKLTAKYQSQKS